jgi:hypothetical protein
MDCRGTVTRAERANAAWLVAATIDHFRIAAENTVNAQPQRVPTH